MTRLDEEADVRIHESDLHRHVLSIGEDSAPILPPPLDEAEDVIPPPTVQSTRMRSQFPKDLVHLKRRGQRFDEDSGADGPSGDTTVRLRKVEDVRPKPCFQMMLHLGEIKVRTGTMREEIRRVVEEIKRKVEHGPRHRLVIDQHTGLIEMPSSGPVRN